MTGVDGTSVRHKVFPFLKAIQMLHEMQRNPCHVKYRVKVPMTPPVKPTITPLVYLPPLFSDAKVPWANYQFLLSSPSPFVGTKRN